MTNSHSVPPLDRPMESAREGMRPPYELATTDNLDVLLAVLPPSISRAVEEAGEAEGYESLVEIVMDLGRVPEARFQAGETPLGQREITRDDLAYVADR